MQLLPDQEITQEALYMMGWAGKIAKLKMELTSEDSIHRTLHVKTHQEEPLQLHHRKKVLTECVNPSVNMQMITQSDLL